MAFDSGSDLVGRVIAGRYELRDVLGRGGMATVYRAYQATLDRQVAVKVIAPTLAHDPAFVERFRREARTVARLRHPNILTVHDFGEDGGLLYFVTELIAGGTLQSRLHETRPAENAVDLIAQVGAALDFAHAQGIVHRDVKPLNIFLDAENGEQAILADFGIAKATAETTATGLTGTGLSIGTPEYMAPEQLTGGEIDGRADLYALAVIAYQLLTGRLPIARGGPHDTPIALAMRKVNTPPPAPSTFNPYLPVAADRVLLRALASEPRERFATAADFVGALRAALASRENVAPPRPAAPPFTPRRPTWEYPPPVQPPPPAPPLAASPPPSPPRPAEVAPAPTVRAYQPPPAQPRFEPLAPSPTTPMAEIPPPPAAPPGPPSRSRRGWLPLAGALGALLVVCFLVGFFGRGLLARAGIGVAPTATARPDGTVAGVPTLVGSGNLASPTRTVGPEPSSVPTSTISPNALATPAATVAPTPTVPPATPTVAPPPATPTAVPPTATTAPPTATRTAVAGGVPPLPAASGPPTGQLLYSSDREGRWAIYLVRPDGTGERRLTGLEADNYHGVWSPDGKQIAFVSERDNNPEIYLMTPDGGNQRRLTTDQGQHAAPAWGSDSGRVAYVLRTGGVEAVYFAEIATGKRTGLINAPAGWPAWASTDDIAWTRVEGGFVNIYLSTVTGATSRKLPRPAAQSEDTPAFSPDGRYLAFAGGPKDDRQIIVCTLNGENRRAITARGADNSNPVWSPDGAYIAYSSTASGTQQLVVMKNDGTEARAITTGPGKKWYLSWR